MSTDQNGRWSQARLIGFRFLFSYLVFFNIPQAGSASIVDFIPKYSDTINAWLAKPMQIVALWLGVRFFHLQGIAATFHPTGSGDTALNYVLVFICLCLAIIATVVWSVFDRRRLQYRTLEAWLRLVIAIVVGISLLGYGFAKVYPGQFGPISVVRLNERYGDSSPMGLLWTFMSGSRWYTMFGGFAEVIPGLMLFFRRTRTLGALMGGAVMLNIVLLNFCYDVPVKLYSSHLLLMCIYLAWPDLKALMRLFLLREQIQLTMDHVPAPERRWLRYTGYAAFAIVLGCTLYSTARLEYTPYPAPLDTHAPLYGRWHVDHASATTELVPWSDVYVNQLGSIMLKQVDGKSVRLTTQINPAQHSIAVTSKKFGNETLHYTLDPTDPHKATISGPFNKGQLEVQLTRVSPDQYSLLTRGFHWINEDPPNW